jgi:hypothetical protein
MDQLKVNVMMQGIQSLQRAFNKFLMQHHIHTVLGDFNGKENRKDVFKSTTGNGSRLKLFIIGLQ